MKREKDFTTIDKSKYYFTNQQYLDFLSDENFNISFCHIDNIKKKEIKNYKIYLENKYILEQDEIELKKYLKKGDNKSYYNYNYDGIYDDYYNYTDNNQNIDLDEMIEDSMNYENSSDSDLDSN